MGTYCIEHLGHPPKLNALLNTHWGRRGRIKKAYYQVLGLAARRARVPEATGKRRVSLLVTLGPRQRGGDPDAYYKVVNDGLVACRTLRGDSKEWVELGGVVFCRGREAATAITLEDIEEGGQ